MHKRTRLLIMVVVATTLLFSASSCTAPANNEPVIASLEPEAEHVVPLDSIEVVCTASDPDGDELNYIWSTNGGQISGGGTMASWTAPTSEGSYNVTVKVIDGLGGEATASVAITVRTNRAPSISLSADADWTTPLGNLELTCTASDPDGDKLSYAWSASGGDVSGTSTTATWTAPQEAGAYDVTVIVTDDYGGEAMGTIFPNVLTGEPPVIEALLITAEHCYLKPDGEGYYVGKNQTYAIECVVADTNVDLFYGWSCSGGDLSGDGSLVIWVAPDAAVDVTVTVEVADLSGSMATENLALSVVPCSYCMFGC